ncbi:5'/3'-nucleotidase SurE [Ascoidea rubescens DSM 1968]|uniref:5'/3'-nucleotidase sure n=1 Tax=Ascoidea rubescens DSM 1968 TaxID=1344418 RepID=A0A1D2VCN0_9ASCO|nr:5'/3'-nucleotidase sure [Ascoidea rubescens DSM 1968]ODV59396.1 5'/3'-nucleotidase sure [Ascoidea rubescens DSM 1968]
MHVLLTNDDGPLNDVTSPYIRHFVNAIEKHTDWDLSIVLPNVQRSWIGKAHFAGKELTASFIYPTKENNNSYNGPFAMPDPNLRRELKEWALIDGTPASCADIGIYHLYKEKGPVDLVLSGPNFGRNTTSSYIMTSGTVGAAIEASLQNKKAIGISFGFFTKKTDPSIIQEACRIGVKIVDHLYKNWPNDNSIELYTINIPLVETLSLETTKIIYTSILQNKWVSLFKSHHYDNSNSHKHINNRDDNSPDSETVDIVDTSITNQLQFKWSPNFSYVHETILNSEGANDGQVVNEGNISVTPLRAIYAEVPMEGEIKLD